MKIKSILIAANNYPTPTDSVSPFVEKLAVSIARRGIKVTVIAPYRIVQHYLRKTELHPKRREIKVNGGVPITIIQPRYITLGRRFEGFNLQSAKRAIYKEACKLKDRPDVCYGYFWHWTYCLYDYAKENKIPLVAHNGETPIMLSELYDKDQLSPFSDYVKAVVCNSSYCKQISQEAALTIDEKCGVFPNAIDGSIFYPRDKQALRMANGIKDDDFVIAYTGWFDDNKGAVRLSNAITKLNDKNIKSIFIGEDRSGNFDPTCDGIIHKGRLVQTDIPNWLSMADLFVLPTQHEGSSNAIVEAMACGLPIISSDRSFNWDVLNENNSILIDPMNVEEIAEAIKKLKDDKELRIKMAKAALETAVSLTVERRAERIVNFIESKI